jgi:hypothetical protein
LTLSNSRYLSRFFFLFNFVIILTKTKHHTNTKHFHPSKSTMQLSLFLLSAAALVNAATAADPVNLGTAGDYAVLAKAGISTAADSAITGDIAVSPIAATAMTGFSLILDSGGTFSKSEKVTGDAYASDYATPIPARLTTAVSNMETAYTDAAGRPNPDAARTNVGAGEIGGLALTPGVYTFSTDVTITSDVTFSGTGVYIIQIAGNIVQAADTKVTLTNGAEIFWQVAGSVEVGAGSTMEGILLVKTKVDFLAGAKMNGSVLTQTACNLLEGATITEKPDTSTRRSLRGNTQ